MEIKTECSGNECKTCGEFKARPFELRVYRVRGLNKPFTRAGLTFGKVLHLIDSTIGIITFGNFGSNIGAEWIHRDLDKFFQYNEDDTDNKDECEPQKFKLEPFKFKIYRIGKPSRPFTMSERVFGHMLHVIDSIIGIITFAHFESSLYLEWSSRELNKLGQYVEKYGVEALRKGGN